MGNYPFLWIGDPDPDHLFILLCDPFPDPDTDRIADPGSPINDRDPGQHWLFDITSHLEYQMSIQKVRSNRTYPNKVQNENII